MLKETESESEETTSAGLRTRLKTSSSKIPGWRNAWGLYAEQRKGESSFKEDFVESESGLG